MSQDQIIESLRVRQGEDGSEETKAIFREISELKSMISALMNVIDSFRIDELREMVNQHMVNQDEVENACSTIVPLSEQVDRLYNACLAMAAKVDADATPSTPYTDTFTSNT